MDAGAAISRTDLHTHILPGVDDGAIDLAEATAMAKVALDDGIVCLAATPHSLRWPTGTVEADLISRVAALEHSLAAQALPLRVVIGAETALIPALPLQIDAGQVVTLNHSRYLLIEPVFGGLPAEAEDILLQVQARGLVPVLAHPERSPDVQRQPQRLSRLVEQGALVQITAGSLEGRFGPAPQRLARDLLAANLVHVIASDAHSAHARPPHLARAQALAADIVGAERALTLVAANPAAILDDRPLEVEPPQWPTIRRRFWLF